MICFFKFPLEDSLGGAELHTLKLARHFADHGRGVKLFTSDQKLFRLFEKNNLPRQRIMAGPEPVSRAALWHWPITYLRARFAFKKILKSIPLESVCFFQSLTEKIVLTPLAVRGGIKVLWLEHKVPGRWMRNNPLLQSYKRLGKQIRIITVSNFAKKEFINLGMAEKNIQVIYPGIRTPPYFPSLVKEGAGGLFTIGVLSRLDPEKGVLNFLRHGLPYLQKHQNWEILMAGSGKERLEIIELAKSAGLEDRVEMIGFLKDKTDFFSRISVLAYPSRVAESFGVAALEAQAHGVPVVAARLGALEEIIKHGETGLLVDQDKPEQWGEYLEKLDSDRQFAAAVSKNGWSASQKFSEGRMFQAFDRLLI
ncbi:MAG: glycosyltransferase family 4 protein [Candidatus Doudnabacteria bacterium]|nr:glycosyltransferase family 4 protein [Candidatus Doudnabacteria bacterium]